MRITHICLAGPVTDNWNYQDNLLTKYHKKMGHDVTIITSQWIWSNDGQMIKDNRSRYINSDGISVIRLPISNRDSLSNKFKKYKDFQSVLEECNSQILFVHSPAFLDVRVIVKYLKKYREITVYVDNHADFSNSATNWFSKNILHKGVWKHYAKMLEPYVKRFYGVLPARVDFLVDIYGIPKEKVELLVMGADDELVEESLKPEIKKSIRSKYGIKDDDFLIVNGGKIDEAKKQTLLLMDAVNGIADEKVKLIVFGSVVSELKEEVEKRCSKKVQYIGWVESNQSNNYFAAANLVVFPGRHSVFWEQVVALGVPMVVKHWEGTTHVDIGENVKFLYKDSVQEIKECLENILGNDKTYQAMKKCAEGENREQFLYSRIARQSIRDKLDDY